MPTADSFRQGVAGAALGWPVAQRHELGSWGYHWTLEWFPNTYPTNVEQIPFLMWRPWEVEDPVIPGIPTRPTVPVPDMATTAAMAALTPHNYWLIFNECESLKTQCRTGFQAAADSYASNLVPFLNSVDPNAKLIIGGVNAHECGILWLKNFVEYYTSNIEPTIPYLAGWHFHLYPDIVPNDWTKEGIEGCDSSWDFNDARVENVDDAWDAWQTDVHNILAFVSQYGDLIEDEIWITEMGCLNPGWHEGFFPTPRPVCGKVGYMYEYTRRITNWLNTTGRWIDRYAWYTDVLGEPHEGYTRLYELTPIPPSPTPGGPPTDTPTPGYTPVTPDFSALGYFYGGVTPAAPITLSETIYFPVWMKSD